MPSKVSETKIPVDCFTKIDTCARSKYAILAEVITAVVAAILVSVALCVPMGGQEFLAVATIGGVSILLALAGLIVIAVSFCKKKNIKTPPDPQETLVDKYQAVVLPDAVACKKIITDLRFAETGHTFNFEAECSETTTVYEWLKLLADHTGRDLSLTKFTVITRGQVMSTEDKLFQPFLQLFKQANYELETSPPKILHMVEATLPKNQIDQLGEKCLHAFPGLAESVGKNPKKAWGRVYESVFETALFVSKAMPLKISKKELESTAQIVDTMRKDTSLTQAAQKRLENLLEVIKYIQSYSKIEIQVT